MTSLTHISHPAPARPGPLVVDPIFVTFPQASRHKEMMAQAVVLAALVNEDVGPALGPRLVESGRHELVGKSLPPSLTKGYGKHYLALRVMDDPRRLREILFHPRSYTYAPALINRREIHLDEAYLHSTLSDWSSSSLRSKFLITASSFSATRSWTFTVNLSKRRQESLSKNPEAALRRLRNPLSDLSRLGPAMLALEWTDSGRLHLHGVLSSQEEPREIRRVLRTVGGHSANTQFRNGYQVKARPLVDAMGWAQYVFKGLVDLPDAQVDERLYISSSAKGMANTHLGFLREQARKKFDTRPEWRGRAKRYH